MSEQFTSSRENPSVIVERARLAVVGGEISGWHCARSREARVKRKRREELLSMHCATKRKRRESGATS